MHHWSLATLLKSRCKFSMLCHHTLNSVCPTVFLSRVFSALAQEMYVPLLSPAQNIDYWFKSIHTKNVSLCSWYLCLWHLHDKIVLKKIDKTIISVRYLSYAHSFQAKIYFHLDWYSYQYNFVLIYLHFYYFIKICTCRVRFSNLPQYCKAA